ncbi:hypothetical protein [Actinokineospora sp. NPDC004072]
MKRPRRSVGTALALAAFLGSVPAAAVAEAAAPPPEDGWTYYREFSDPYTCEFFGAAGAFGGRWSDWRCDDDNVLWTQ